MVKTAQKGRTPVEVPISRIRTTTFERQGLPQFFIKWKSVAYMPWAEMRNLLPNDAISKIDTDRDYALKVFAANLIVEWNIPGEDDKVLALPKNDITVIDKMPTAIAVRFLKDVEEDVSKISL